MNHESSSIRAQMQGNDTGQAAWRVSHTSDCDLELHKNVLHKGGRELTAHPQQALPGHGAMKLKVAEIKQLEGTTQPH